MSMKGEKAATPKTPVSTLWLQKHTPLPDFWDHTNTLNLAEQVYRKGFHTKSTAVLVSFDLRIQHYLELSHTSK